MEEMFNSIFGFLGQITSVVRDFITSLSAEYSTAILLGLSMVGGYFLYKKYPQTFNKIIFVLLGLVIFLMLRFI